MNILLETIAIAVCMGLLTAVPALSPWARAHSKFFYYLGTGALVGILAFDLLPDLVGIGGSRSLVAVGAVWVVYSLVHLWHMKVHRSECDAPHEHGSGSIHVFFLSMTIHCVASGLLLVASNGISKGFQQSVFWALLAHKAYESLTVSSVIMERVSDRKNSLALMVLYTMALPFGVAMAVLFQESITSSVALLLTCLAAGSLLGCLCFDFLLPSLQRIRSQKTEIVWMAAGLLFTQFLLRFL